MTAGKVEFLVDAHAVYRPAVVRVVKEAVALVGRRRNVRVQFVLAERVIGAFAVAFLDAVVPKRAPAPRG